MEIFTGAVLLIMLENACCCVTGNIKPQSEDSHLFAQPLITSGTQQDHIVTFPFPLLYFCAAKKKYQWL